MGAAALVVFCAVPLRSSRTAAATRADWKASGPLRAGAAKVRIELPAHPVLAGYAGHRRAREVEAPVHARALVIEVRGRLAYLVALDTLLIPPDFAAPPGCGLLAATHTHTGPGGLWDNAVAGLLGAGAPAERQRRAVQEAMLAAVAQAARALQPAELQVGREVWTFGPSRARSEGPLDPSLTALRLRTPAGDAIATVIVYAMHPTSAPREVLSPDWPGELDGSAPVLVLQGAGGNATWAREVPLAAAVAREVAAVLEGAPALSEAPLECAMRSVEVPQAQASPRVPLLLRRAAANALTLAFSPLAATQTRLRIGPVTLLGVPGEPVGELGIAARPAVLVGLAGGYLGYVETPQRWREGRGESGRSYFGPDLAHALGLWPR